MKALTEADIRDSFVNAARVRRSGCRCRACTRCSGTIANTSDGAIPASPQRGYVVSWQDGRAIGIVLRAAEARLQVGSAICSLCNTPQPAGQVTMFSAVRAGDAGRRGDSVGTYICADLACSLLIRIAPPQYEMQPSPEEVVAARAAGLQARLDAFVGRVLQDAA